jgi:hypothetical protein
MEQDGEAVTHFTNSARAPTVSSIGVLVSGLHDVGLLVKQAEINQDFKCLPMQVVKVNVFNAQPLEGAID